MAQVLFSWEPAQEPQPSPFPTMSIQQVCKSTEMKCSLSLFSFQEQWGMLVFSFFMIGKTNSYVTPYIGIGYE